MNIPTRIYHIIDYMHQHPEVVALYYVLHGDGELKLLEEQIGEQRVDVPFLLSLIAKLEIYAHLTARGGIN